MFLIASCCFWQALASCSCFQSFLQKTISEIEQSIDEDLVDSLPLAVSLATLLEGSSWIMWTLDSGWVFLRYITCLVVYLKAVGLLYFTAMVVFLLMWILWWLSVFARYVDLYLILGKKMSECFRIVLLLWSLTNPINNLCQFWAAA